ncbi:extracellular solute-binding protein [Cohnella silvisoli]|uniref:Extracellular solute-binding protein n=1 Tax=Cohnella silvisoli TaxID=2873699 RepID=A0ABV1L0K0_9BACL|nr:extracellular solute-binding protein [Cohnella silvisoli]MCD9025044.1 extracellular solute-binding protein [Cohnella silvisoli]
MSRKSRTTKTVAVWLFVFAMIAMALAGCTSKKEDNNVMPSQSQATPAESATSNEPASPEPVTLKIFAEWLLNPMPNPVPSDPVAQEITKQTGVTMDFEPFLGGGDAKAKLSALIASGDLPDIVITSDYTIVQNLINNKQVIALEDLIASNGSNIKQFIGDAVKKQRVIYEQPDNKTYFLKPQVYGGDWSPLQANNMWNIRWDLYKKLGKPKLDSLDAFLQVLKDMQQLEPVNKEGKKTYGFGMGFGDSWTINMIDKAIANGRGMFVGVPQYYARDVATDKLVPAMHDPDSIWWKAMDFYAKAYREGVLDPESITQKWGNMSDKASQGRYFAGQAIWALGNVNQYFTAKDGEPDPEKGMVPIPVWTKDKDAYFYAVNDIGNQYFVMISANSEHPDRAMDLLNYLATPEAYETINNGVLGQTWELVDGKQPKELKEFTDFKKTHTPAEIQEKYGVSVYYHMPLWAGLDDPSGFKALVTNDEQYLKENTKGALLDYMNINNLKYPMEVLDQIPNNTHSGSLQSAIALPQGTDLASKAAQMSSYQQSMAPGIIASKTEEDYNANKAKFIDEIKKMGIEEVFQFFNDKYEELKIKVQASQ